jgi:hypothetical protein
MVTTSILYCNQLKKNHICTKEIDKEEIMAESETEGFKRKKKQRYSRNHCPHADAGIIKKKGVKGFIYIHEQKKYMTAEYC